jgi:hypothetical protein
LRKLVDEGNMPEDKDAAQQDSVDMFDWGLHPDLEKFVLDRVSSFLANHKFAKMLSEKMLSQTSTKFVDWMDHITLPESRVKPEALEQLGLEEVKTRGSPEGARVYKHLGTYLVPILLSGGSQTELALKPEAIDSFLQALGSGVEVEGTPFAEFRRAIISSEGDYVLSAVERRGYDGFTAKESDDVGQYLKALSSFSHRQRFFNTDEEGMESVEELVLDSLKNLDSARVSDAFFRAERVYWQGRNRAGQVQKARQDTLGLGWGNHDHHTYRSSRSNFTKMIEIFEKMGYTCREKYYAGERAGWGAQILEHPVCNIVVFTDVDLGPDETKIDFAHEGFAEREEGLGTVGLWIGLHGESLLQAGMHHLEARFDFEKLTQDLPEQGAQFMPPFSHFEFLKQAFTVGERWPVEKKRLDKLLSANYITKEQYDQFLRDGAIGSHMENLERDQGFKGFNRASVTKIIMDTDPRKQHYSGA